jgi:hypothetical protein
MAGLRERAAKERKKALAVQVRRRRHRTPFLAGAWRGAAGSCCLGWLLSSRAGLQAARRPHAMHGLASLCAHTALFLSVRWSNTVCSASSTGSLAVLLRFPLSRAHRSHLPHPPAGPEGAVAARPGGPHPAAEGAGGGQPTAAGARLALQGAAAALSSSACPSLCPARPGMMLCSVAYYENALPPFVTALLAPRCFALCVRLRAELFA